MLPEAEAKTNIRIFEPDNARLLAIGHGTAEDDASLNFACDTGSGALLAYYFGKGRRRVVVQSGRNEGVAAHLATRWNKGHREWTVDW